MKRSTFLKQIIGLPFLVGAISEVKAAHNIIPSYARNQHIIITPQSRLDGDTIDWDFCDVEFKNFPDFRYSIKDNQGVEIYSLDKTTMSDSGYRRTIINYSKKPKISNTVINTSPTKTGTLHYGDVNYDECFYFLQA